MKKTLLAIAVAGLSTSAFAEISTENSEFTTKGTVGIGGYYDTASEAFYDDWATAITVKVNYKNDALVGYLEVDLEQNYSTDEEATKIENESVTDVDKAWIGWDTGFGVASIGWENDTALDKVDGAGDLTYEFGSSAGDASDGFNVVKFQGSTSGFAYGISYFETADDHDVADSGVNGYLGLEQESFNVYAGYESRDDADYKVLSLSGNATFGQFKAGLNYWVNDGDASDLTGTNATEKEQTGFYASVSYAVTEKFTLAAGYFDQTTEEKAQADVDENAYNIAATYTISERADMGIDIKRTDDTKTGDEETHVFAAAYYHF
ncbi:porin [Vibrio sp. SCSIO 43137]|uniref:porin n=1 Tax=Vibrio sp. SCSIO 43137 TaxID=3021011 RepID=UPI0023076FA5|nr:porin [Vibrio sp. SCSIO 43137]WCE28493.1 porin [Vibrio sp. SCSIO 43137]